MTWLMDFYQSLHLPALLVYDVKWVLIQLQRSEKRQNETVIRPHVMWWWRRRTLGDSAERQNESDAYGCRRRKFHGSLPDRSDTMSCSIFFCNANDEFTAINTVESWRYFRCVHIRFSATGPKWFELRFHIRATLFLEIPFCTLWRSDIRKSTIWLIRFNNLLDLSLEFSLLPIRFTRTFFYSILGALKVLCSSRLNVKRTKCDLFLRVSRTSDICSLWNRFNVCQLRDTFYGHAISDF